jgi:hypothetical protein
MVMLMVVVMLLDKVELAPCFGGVQEVQVHNGSSSGPVSVFLFRVCVHLGFLLVLLTELVGAKGVSWPLFYSLVIWQFYHLLIK